jgi:hypothetical protein
MDIRRNNSAITPAQKTIDLVPTGNSHEPRMRNITSSSTVGGRSGKTAFNSGQHKVASSAMIPAPLRAQLSAVSQKYALPVDLGNCGIQDATPENIKAMRKIADMVEGNSKLLPELMKQIKRILNGDIKEAQFQKNLAKAAIRHGERLDKEVADIFLAYAKHTMKSSKLEHRTNTRAALLEKREQLNAQHYESSVFGAESAIMDAEFEVLANNQKILQESKTKRLEFKQQHRQQLQAYVDSAFTD